MIYEGDEGKSVSLDDLVAGAAEGEQELGLPEGVLQAAFNEEDMKDRYGQTVNLADGVTLAEFKLILLLRFYLVLVFIDYIEQ